MSEPQANTAARAWLSAFDAASAGALLHGLAGDAAAWDGERGLLPSDLLPHVRRLANP